MLKNIFLDLIKFIKHPKDEQLNYTKSLILKTIGIILIIEILFTFLIIVPLNYGINSVLNIKTPRFEYRYTLLFALGMYVLIIPLLEEIFFRLFLRYNGLNKLIFKKEKWEKLFPFFVYLSAIFFGLMHITNYTYENINLILFAPIIIASQLIGGFIIAYIRVKFNFGWGVIYHWTWNFIFAFAFPLLVNAFTPAYIEETKDHQLQIAEKVFFDDNKEQSIEIDSSNNKIYSIKVNQYSIQSILDTLNLKDKYYVNDVLINMDFSSKEGVSKEELIPIIDKKFKFKKVK